MKPEMSAPIPGANLVSDTRNYPWHRPADIVEYDEAVDYMITRISEDEQAELIYSLLQIDINVTTVVSSLLMQAVSKGKIGIDLALLIAGPVARYIEIVDKTEGYKYDMGIDDSDRIRITPTLMKTTLGIVDDEEELEEDVDAVEGTAEPDDGLMAAPVGDAAVATQDEQAAMLGMVEEEENIDGLA